MARQLVPSIQNRITHASQRSGSGILVNYNQSLYKINQPVGLRKGKERIISTLIGVDASGLLITDQGSFSWGEVEFR